MRESAETLVFAPVTVLVGDSALVANSIGYYDGATHERQIAHGIEG